MSCKCNNIIKLSSYYWQTSYRNRDKVKARIRWIKTKWGAKDEWRS